MKVLLACFSGTGNTRFLARLLAKEIENKEIACIVIDIEEIVKEKAKVPIFEKNDILGIVYPVYGLDAPRIVYDFINKLPDLPLDVSIIKSPGDPFFRGGTAEPLINGLSEKGYHVFNESMIVMPPNIFIRCGDEFMERIIRVAEKRAVRIAGEIIEREKRRDRLSIWMRTIAHISSWLLRVGASRFGKDLYAEKTCTKCGKCVKSCPRDNIFMKEERVEFGKNCLVCLRCVYYCPAHAIVPRKFSFFPVKPWYNLIGISQGRITPEARQGRWKKLFYSWYEKYFSEN